MHDITEIINLNEEIINTQKSSCNNGLQLAKQDLKTGMHVVRVAEYSYLLAGLA